MTTFNDTITEDLEFLPANENLVDIFDMFNSVSDDLYIGSLTPPASTVTFNTSISGSLLLYDLKKFGWVQSISEDLKFLTTDDVIYYSVTVPVREFLSFVPSLSSLIDSHVTINESWVIRDSAKIYSRFIDTISESLKFLPAEEIVTEVVGKLLKEFILLTPAVESLAVMSLDMVESLILMELISFRWSHTIPEALTVADNQAVLYYLFVSISQSLTIRETDVLSGFNANNTISESLSAEDLLTIKQNLFSILEDGLFLSIDLELDDELWECWVLNTGKFAASVYSSFDFNSYAIFNNSAYGAKSDGVYRLSGDDDAGTAIKSGLILPDSFFGTNRQKRIRKAYFGISGSAPSLKVITDSGTETYTITNSRTSVSRDMKGRKWQLKLQSFDDLDFIEILPIVLQR